MVRSILKSPIVIIRFVGSSTRERQNVSFGAASPAFQCTLLRWREWVGLPGARLPGVPGVAHVRRVAGLADQRVRKAEFKQRFDQLWTMFQITLECLMHC